MSPEGIIRLIDRLRNDFGAEILITRAPVATGMHANEHLSVCDYQDLEIAPGDQIAWSNTQFYCGWSSLPRDVRSYLNIATPAWLANPQSSFLGYALPWRTHRAMWRLSTWKVCSQIGDRSSCRAGVASQGGSTATLYREGRGDWGSGRVRCLAWRTGGQGDGNLVVASSS